MTDRDRLIELFSPFADGTYNSSGIIIDGTKVDDVVDAIIADGWFRPPCKVGQTVYPLNADPRFKAFIERIETNANGLQFEWVQYDVGVDCTEIWDAEIFDIEDIGKTVFLNETEYLIAKGVITKEEAEAELRKRSEDNG